MINLQKKQIGKVPAPLLRKPAPAPVLPPRFIFSDSPPPSGGGI